MAKKDWDLKKLYNLPMGVGILLILGFMYFNAGLIWDNFEMWQKIIMANMVMVTFAYTFQKKSKFEFMNKSFIRTGGKLVFMTIISTFILSNFLGIAINPAYFNIVNNFTTEFFSLSILFLVMVAFVEESIFREIIPDIIGGKIGVVVANVLWASWHLFVYSTGGVIIWGKFILLFLEGYVYSMKSVRKSDMNYVLHASMNIVKSMRSLI